MNTRKATKPLKAMHTVAPVAADPSGYQEQTVFMPMDDGHMEIHGADGYGWYADKRDVARFNAEVRRYRRIERIKPGEWSEDAPLPLQVSAPAKDAQSVYLLQPDGSPMVRDWLTLNGALVSEPLDDEDADADCQANRAPSLP